MRIFDFDDYKTFVLARIKAMPNRGHGEFRKIAQALRTHSTRISHVFQGNVDLTLEQACGLATHLGLNDLETEYLVALVQRERAGTPALKRVFERQLEAAQAKSRELVHRVDRDRVLTEADKSTFYSNWYYTGIRIASSVPEYQNVDALAQYFDLPRGTVQKVIDFLLQTGLCIADEKNEGRIKMGPKVTHLEATSPLVARHHANWRMKAMQRHEKLGPSELAYTAPISIAEKDQDAIREMSVNFVERVLKVVKASEPEEKLMCLCVDWFEF
jgi:uncharacterized protein (TIGR02147 family)